MTLDQYAREVLQRAAARVEKEIAQSIEDPGVDPVHDLRVSIRRMVQALRTFGELLPGKEARGMRRALKSALDAAAVTRDLDVGTAMLEKDGLPDGHALLAKMASDRRRAAMALQGQLYLLRSEEIPSAWTAKFESLRTVPEEAGLVARETLPPLAGEFFKAGRKAALRAATPERLHGFRLAAKRFRYTLEIFRPFYGPVFQQRMERVREIQSLLGKRQDCAVMAARLRPHSSIDEALAAALAAVEKRGAHCEEEFQTFWHDTFDAEGEELRWQRYLSRRPAVRTVIP